MASQYKRLLECRQFSAADDMETHMAWDAGAYRVLEVQVRVLSAGSSGTEYVQILHAPANEKDAYQVCLDDSSSTAQVALNATGATFIHIPAFTRFVRWSVTGGSGDPVVQMDVVAKE